MLTESPIRSLVHDPPFSPTVGKWGAVSTAITTPPHSPAVWWDFTNTDRLTLTGSDVDAAADQVGSNDVTGTTTTRPDYFAADSVSGVGGRIRFDTDVLEIPSGVSFDNSELSIFVVLHGASNVLGAGSRGSLVHAPTGSTNIALYLWDNGEVRAWDGTARSSGFRAGRCIETAWMIGGASNSWIGLDAQTLERGSAFTAKTASGGRVGLWSGVNFPYGADMMTVVLYDKALSLSQKDDVLSWSNVSFGAPKPNTDTLIIADGDSITEGVQLAGSVPANADVNYLQQLQLLHPNNTFRAVNRGKGSNTLQSNVAATDVIGQLAAGSSYTTRVVVPLWLHNDVQQGRNATECKGFIDTYTANIRVADPGAQIAFCTILNSSGFNATEQAVVDEVNAYIRDDISGPNIDFHIDTQAISELSDDTDTSIFIDGTHLTTLGYSYLATGVDTKLISESILTAG